MLLPRFFHQQPIDLNDLSKLITLSADNSHKVIKVLRLKVGNKLCLFQNNIEFNSEIIEMSRNSVVVKVLEINKLSRESTLNISLALSITKANKMDIAIQKATELGVTNIIPIIAKHSVVQLNNLQNKLSHWLGIIQAACCQCGRNIVPTLSAPISFTEFIEQDETQHSNKIILHSEFSQKLSKEDNFDLGTSISMLVGPEGGFHRQELELAATKNFKNLAIGPRILRAETAVISAISILQNLYGDM